MKRKFIFATWLLYILCLPSYALTTGQNSNLRFNHISLEQGLSQSVVTFIAQDKTGLMWLATQDGLNVYDGNKITIFKHSYLNKNSLSDNNINHILVDSRNRVFIATDGGLDLYDPSINGFKRINLLANELHTEPRRVHVTALAEDLIGNIWALTHHGVFLYNIQNEFIPASKYFTKGDSKLLDQYYYCIFIRNNNVWIGGDKKLVAVDNLERVVDRTGLVEDDIEFNKIYSVNEDLVFASNKGLYRLDTNKLAPYLVNYIKREDIQDSIFSNDTIWVGTESGLTSFNLKTKSLATHTYSANNRSGLSSSDVLSLFIDRAGVFWIGTYGGGVNIWNPDTAQFGYQLSAKFISDKLPENNVWGIWSDERNQLWIGASRNVLVKVEPESNAIRHYNVTDKKSSFEADSDVNTVIGDASGKIWVGTSNSGLYWFNPQTEEFTSVNRIYPNLKTLSKDIVAIYADRNADMYVGTSKGLLKFSLQGKSYEVKDISKQYNKQLKRSDNRVGVVYHDTKDNLWIGTGSGLVVSHKGRYLFLGSGREKSLLTHSEIFGITEDKYGNVWVGTADGLNQVQVSGDKLVVSERLNEEAGLFNDTIYGVLSDKSANLWLATNNGLIKYNPMLRNMTQYKKEHGLQSNEFNQGAVFLDATGVMYFGGINGINRFHPDDLTFKNYTTTVTLSSISTLDHSLGFAMNHLSEVNIEGAEDEPIEFQLSIDDYTRDTTSLRYRVNAEQWRNISGKTLTLSFSQGNQIIEFQAADRGNEYRGATKTVKLHVKGGFWKTERIIIAVQILVCFLLVAYIVWLHRVKKQVRMAHSNEVNFMRRQQNILSKLANSFQKENTDLEEEALKIKSRLQSLQKQWHQQRYIDNVTELRNFYPNNLELIEFIQTRLNNYEVGVGMVMFRFEGTQCEAPLEHIHLSYISRQLSEHLKNYFDSDVVIMRLQENSFCLVVESFDFIEFDQEMSAMFNQLELVSFERNNQDSIEVEFFRALAFIPKNNALTQTQLQALFVNLESHLEFNDSKSFKIEILNNIPPDITRFIEHDLSLMIELGLVKIH